MLLQNVRDMLGQLNLLDVTPPHLQQKLVALLLACSDQFSFSSGEVLLAPEQEGSGGLVVLSGRVQIAPAQGAVAEVCGPVFLGERQLFEQGMQRTATVTAASPGEALRFPWFRLALWRDELINEQEEKELAHALVAYTSQWQDAPPPQAPISADQSPALPAGDAPAAE